MAPPFALIERTLTRRKREIRRVPGGLLTRRLRQRSHWIRIAREISGTLIWVIVS